VTSITLGVDGKGLIAFFDGVAHCDDVACSSATISLLPGAGPGVAIGTDGLGVIYGPGGRALHCSDVRCTSYTVVFVQNFGCCDVAVAPSGQLVTGPNVSSDSESELIVGGGTGLNGSSGWHWDDPEAADVGVMTVGADGLPMLAYDVPAGWRMTHCSDPHCAATTSTLISPPPAGRPPTSITVGWDGLPIIVGEGAVVHCTDLHCSSYTVSQAPLGPGSSVTLAADGMPLISFIGGVAHCSSTFCSKNFRRR
jgi:hypothetical protein